MTARVSAALVAAQHELRAITKDSTNPHFKNKYASLDTIIDTVRPILAKHELALMQGADAADGGKALNVTTVLIHVSGEVLHTSVYVPLAKADPQGAGGALTYGRRYGISALLCLATEEDDDGNNASRPPAAKRSPAPKPEPAPATNGATNGTPRSIPKWLGLAGDRPMPFGDTKGQTLGSHSTKALQKVLTWCRAPERASEFADLAKDISTVLNSRALGDDDDSKVERMKAVVAAEGDGLPFK